MDYSGVPPGDLRTYEYDLGDQTGTYWIHSHVDVSLHASMLLPFINFAKLFPF